MYPKHMYYRCSTTDHVIGKHEVIDIFHQAVIPLRFGLLVLCDWSNLILVSETLKY